MWRSFLYDVNSRALHLGMSQKRDKDPRSARHFFLATVVSVLKLADIYIIFTFVVVGMRRSLCLCNICLLYTWVIQKGRVIPILSNRFDEMSKMKTVVEDRKSSHRLGDY